jgi:hypothetical protein
MRLNYLVLKNFDFLVKPADFNGGYPIDHLGWSSGQYTTMVVSMHEVIHVNITASHGASSAGFSEAGGIEFHDRYRISAIGIDAF